MLTNRINVTFNLENIDTDFDIYKVEKANKDYYKYNILDSAIYEFKAVAVQWTFGATALVLFNKGEVTEQQFKESIMKEYEDVKIQKIDLFDSEQCKCFQYQNRLLAQLLMNSMRTPKHDELRYSNLTGKLFYHNPAWKRKDKLTGKVDIIRFLEIVIDPGMYLNLNHETFRRVDREELGTHVIDSKTGEFRKKLKSDTNTTAYKKGSLRHSHFNITAIMNMLQETDEKQKVQKNILLQAINEFELEYPDYFENVKKWKTILLDKEEIITKKEVKKVLNMRTNAASMFNRFLHEKFDIWIYGEWRKEEFDAIYQIGNLLNIKYEYNDNDYDDGHTFVYYVGAKSKRISYPNACCIRKVVSLGDKLEYEEMLPLMAVEFVRNNQYTVLPFPYKYLREYIEQC